MFHNYLSMLSAFASWIKRLAPQAQLLKMHADAEQINSSLKGFATFAIMHNEAGIT